MAGQLIDSLSGPWRPSDYRDTYTDRVNALIDAKRHRKEFEPAGEAPAATKVTDLAQALRASLDAAKKPSTKRSTASKPAAKKRTAAKPAAAKRTAAKRTARRGAA